jgi:hypothetical protein
MKSREQKPRIDLNMLGRDPTAYSGDREQQIHAMVNGAWSRQLEFWFLRQVFTIRQGSSSV